MWRVMRSVALLMLCFSVLAISVSALPYSSDKYASGELLVKFRMPADGSASRAVLQRLSSSVIEKLGDGEWHRVRIADHLTVEQAIAEFSRSSEVVAVQPNFLYYLQVTPNDAQFANAGLYGLTRIAAPTAWDLTTGSSSVVVANIDTGMRMTHEDLAANIWFNSGEIAANGVDDDGNGFIDDVNGWDFFFNDSNPTDEHGHGTHTGGTIGAVGNNLVGVVGVNWNVKIMPIKIYNNTGNGTTSAMLVNAYNYVRMMKQRGVNIRVTNNSYGGCDEACGYDQATKNALDALGDAGVLNVFAAGNNGTNNDVTPFYPASYTSSHIISVANSNSTDGRNAGSCFGLNSVDLAAPGTGIYSSTFSSNSSYGNMSGTSMATPHVAGAAALLFAHNPNLTVASAKATLLNTVDPVAAWSGFVKTGGRLNVNNALRNQTVCSFPASVNVPTKGGIISLALAPGANCDYSARSNATWLKVIDPGENSGSSTIKLRISVNPTIMRTATLSLGGHQMSIIQKRN